MMAAAEHTPGRGAFHGAYSLPKERRDMMRKHRHRLLDLLIGISTKAMPQFMDHAEDKIEFAVIDLLREEKAFFEMPDGIDTEYVHSMIESTFNSRALRIDANTWIV